MNLGMFLFYNQKDDSGMCILLYYLIIESYLRFYYKTISKFLQLNFPVYISGGDTLKEMPMRTLSARVHWSKGLPNEE